MRRWIKTRIIERFRCKYIKKKHDYMIYSAYWSHKDNDSEKSEMILKCVHCEHETKIEI